MRKSTKPNYPEVGKSASYHDGDLVLIGKITYLTDNEIEIKMTTPYPGVRLSRRLPMAQVSDRNFHSAFGFEIAGYILRDIYLNAQKLLLQEEDIRREYPEYQLQKNSLMKRLESLHKQKLILEAQVDVDELSARAMEHEYRLSRIEEEIRSTSMRLLVLPDSLFQKRGMPAGFVRQALKPLLGLVV